LKLDALKRAKRLTTESPPTAMDTHFGPGTRLETLFLVFHPEVGLSGSELDQTWWKQGVV
jgi:hypothetical protein